MGRPLHDANEIGPPRPTTKACDAVHRAGDQEAPDHDDGSHGEHRPHREHRPGHGQSGAPAGLATDDVSVSATRLGRKDPRSTLLLGFFIFFIFFSVLFRYSGSSYVGMRRKTPQRRGALEVLLQPPYYCFRQRKQLSHPRSTRPGVFFYYIDNPSYICILTAVPPCFGFNQNLALT